MSLLPLPRLPKAKTLLHRSRNLPSGRVLTWREALARKRFISKLSSVFSNEQPGHLQQSSDVIFATLVAFALNELQ